jgi:hypothetical protein
MRELIGDAIYGLMLETKISKSKLRPLSSGCKLVAVKSGAQSTHL